MNRKVKSLLLYYKQFGMACFIANILTKLFPYKENGSRFSWRILQFKHRRILKYLHKKYYSKKFTEYVCINRKGLYKNCIWTAWLQGEEDAPEVVRLTLASIRKNSNGHKVIVLTNDNINNYINIPLEIKSKYKTGIIGNAHFADVVRMMILSKYGGLWLDATMFIHKPIDNCAFTTSFFSLGYETNVKTRFITNNKWRVYLIGGLPGSQFISQISKMLNSYWIENDICIDYFVFDYLIAVLYQNDKSFKSTVDSLPQMKYPANQLRIVINEPMKADILEKLFIEHQVFKLTYKQNYHKKTIDGRTTIYGYLYDTLIVN